MGRESCKKMWSYRELEKEKNMKKKLKALLEKSPLSYSILQMCKYRKDKEYIQLIRGLRDNPNIIKLISGEEKFEKPICLINVGEREEGFFACVRWALDALYFCDQYGFTPVVKFSDQSLYLDKNYSETKNVFDYFFEQPSIYETNDLNHHSYIQYTTRNRLLAERMNEGVSYDVTSEYEKEMAEIMKKYLHFNKKTCEIIEKSVKERITSDDVLGVHVRGTDYKGNYKNHPTYILPEEYYPYIKEQLSRGKFKKIYLATDDQEILEKFIREFGKENILYDKNTIRGNNNIGIHTRQHTDQYRMALEVICDMATLSYCSGIISGLSQVGLIARIFKLSRDEEYRYNKKLNKGINTIGKSFKL